MFFKKNIKIHTYQGSEMLTVPKKKKKVSSKVLPGGSFASLNVLRENNGAIY